MKLSLPLSEFLPALRAAARLAANRSVLPVLSAVLVEAQPEGVCIVATDLERGLSWRLPCAPGVGGAACVPAKPLLDILTGLSGQTLDIDREEGGEAVTFRCGPGRYKLLGYRPEDFPPLPEVSGTAWTVELPAPDLLRALHYVSHATSDDDTRPILTGVSWSRDDDGTLTLVATDTHKLAVCPITGAAGPELEFSLPAAATDEWARALQGVTEPVCLAVDDNQAQLICGRVTLLTRRLEGTFPKFRRVIPAAHTRSLACSRQSLLAALKRVEVVARENQQRMVWTVAAEGVTLQAVAGTFGEAEEQVPGEGEGDLPVTLTLHALYCCAILEAHDAEQVRLEMTEPLAPVIVRPADAQHPFTVLMPMRDQ